ncbi:MAG: DUF1214 domain-containing protein [Candidatus Dadabacteria bacterium]|nr:MAG: DUF1214 domain-containing protein [Candidatus Dadabacteria bacterium]
MAHEDPLARLADGTLWEEFCDILKRAGQVVLRERSPKDAFDQAEGYRYLTRLMRLAFEKFIEHNDPATPRFYRLSHETAKIGCDNPDSFYQNCRISGEYEYRLWGNRGTVAYLGFGTYYGHYGSNARSGCSGYLEASDLKIAPDGSFEIILSTDRKPGNWLPMEPDTSMLIVRQNFLDRSSERPAELHIERIGAEGPPAPLDPAELAANLIESARFVEGTARLFAEWAEGFMERPNELVAMDPKVTGGAHGDPNIFFYMGYWRLEPDQALVIELKPPKCEYWNFQLNNHWMESLDYRYHTIHVNKHTARYEADGSVRLVVAARNPGVANWIDTAGHRRGTMGLRWVKADSHPQPSCRVVELPVAAAHAP